MNPPSKINDLINNPLVTDICINGEESVYFESQGRMLQLESKESCFWRADSLRKWILENLAKNGKTWDSRFPFTEFIYLNSHRVHVALPPISNDSIIVSFRRLGKNLAHQAPQTRWGKEYELLKRATQQRETIILSGSTGSGKTTLLNDLLGELDPSERVITLEDTNELRPHHPHHISLTSRDPNPDGFGGVSLRDLLRQALRMRPDRLILGECRGPEVFDLLQALNTGHKGSLATLHANSAREVLSRLEVLSLSSPMGSVPLRVIRGLIALSIQWIAHLEKVSETREIREILKVERLEGDTILTRPML